VNATRAVVHLPDRLMLKVATRALVDAVGGTIPAARVCGSRQQRISDCGLPNTPDFLRIDEVAALEDVTVGQPGWPHVIHALCSRQGGLFVPIRTDAVVGDASLAAWSGYAARLSHEAGSLNGGLCEGLAEDKDVSRQRAGELLGKARQLVQSAVEIEKALEARAEGWL
jgi:hypothetical protein